MGPVGSRSSPTFTPLSLPLSESAEPQEGPPLPGDPLAASSFTRLWAARSACLVPMMVPRLALAPMPGVARGAALGPATEPPGVLPATGASGFAGAPRALDPLGAGLRPLLPPAGDLGVPRLLAGLPLQAAVGPGVGLVGGTPSLGTARAGLPAASLALPPPCPGPSLRSRDPWVAGRYAASALPARTFRLDVALETEWSARPLGLASSSARKKAAAPVRTAPPPGRGVGTGLVLGSRLDLRMGGAGGADPLDLGNGVPLGATLFLPLGAAFGPAKQAAASAGTSPQDVAGVATPRVVAPLRRGGT